MAKKAFDTDRLYGNFMSVKEQDGQEEPAHKSNAKRRVCFAVPADVYADAQKIAQVRLTSVSEIVSRLLTEYVAGNQEALEEYDILKAKSQEKSEEKS